MIKDDIRSIAVQGDPSLYINEIAIIVCSSIIKAIPEFKRLFHDHKLMAGIRDLLFGFDDCKLSRNGLRLSSIPSAFLFESSFCSLIQSPSRLSLIACFVFLNPFSRCLNQV